jgi:hypothetical protein
MRRVAVLLARCTRRLAVPPSLHAPHCLAPRGCACHLAVPLGLTHCIAVLLVPAYPLLVRFFSFSFFSADFFFCGQSLRSPLSDGCVAVLFPRAYHGPTSDRDDGTEGRGGASRGGRARAPGKEAEAQGAGPRDARGAGGVGARGALRAQGAVAGPAACAPSAAHAQSGCVRV